MFCFVSPTIWRWVVLEAVENLGGPALTSHLNTPLVSEAALLRMMWVGEEWANT